MNNARIFPTPFPCSLFLTLLLTTAGDPGGSGQGPPQGAALRAPHPHGHHGDQSSGPWDGAAGVATGETRLGEVTRSFSFEQIYENIINHNL